MFQVNPPMKNQALFSLKDKTKQEMLQYVTNAPEGPLS